MEKMITVVNIDYFVCKKHPESYRFLPGNSNSFNTLKTNCLIVRPPIFTKLNFLPE